MELNKISGRTRLKKRGRKNKNGSTDNLSQAIFASSVIGLILPIAGSVNDKHQSSACATTCANKCSTKFSSVTMKCGGQALSVVSGLPILV